MAAINQRAAPPEPQTYLWSFPGAPVRVNLALDVVVRLQSLLEGRDGATCWGGVLSGDIDGITTSISGFHPLAGGETGAVQSALATLSKAGRNRAVGYYRIQREDGLRLNLADLALAKACFPGPHDVILLIQPSASEPANATFYFWDGGRLNGDFPFLEFPLDARLLTVAEQHRAEAAQRRIFEIPAPVSEASQPARAPRRSVWKPLAWVLLGAGLVGATTFGMRFLPATLAWPWQPKSAQTVENAAPPSIDLRAERQEGDVKLTWNRDAAAIVNAGSAQLSIGDGDVRRSVPLQAAQLRAGSILYTPVTDQVEMALTVSGPSGDITESVLVLLPQTPGQQPISVPQATPESPSGKISRPLPLKPFLPPAARGNTGPREESIASPPLVLASETASSALPLPNMLSSQPAPEPLPEAPPAAPSSPVAAPAQARIAAAYYPPEPVERVRPLASASMRASISKPAIVEVGISIDETGRVVKATPVLKPGANQSLSFAAVTAARQWKFRPARRGNQPVASQMVLRFNFVP